MSMAGEAPGRKTLETPMSTLMRTACVGAVVAMTVMASGAAGAPSPEGKAPTTVDLQRTFKTKSSWRLVATQGPGVGGSETASGAEEPGELQLCLRRSTSASCDPALDGGLREGDSYFSKPHYLDTQVVQGAAGRRYLMVTTASEHGGNGSQLVQVQLLAYQAAQDRFVRAYSQTRGTNNNDDIRFVARGPLKGDVIEVEPTEHAPYGFWVVVKAPVSATGFKQVLRYRSTTRYGDGNPLAVADSEMPNILKRLGRWREGQALPLPAGGCAKPRLIHSELWCQDPPKPGA